ncbi:MAG: hypothetical protein H0W73_14950 [Bacteroidetes bacterium]|nr:hypothetical protein [Bacteroidota bacterium]
MKEIKLIEEKNEHKGELTLENARGLLNDKTMSDERLEKIINSIKIFCKVAYDLYVEEQNKKEEQLEIDNVTSLHSKPTQELKEAA